MGGEKVYTMSFALISNEKVKFEDIYFTFCKKSENKGKIGEKCIYKVGFNNNWDNYAGPFM